MVHRVQYEKSGMPHARCEKCNSTRLLHQRGNLICQNCSHTIYDVYAKKLKRRRSVSLDGKKHDSRFESSIGDELFIRLKANDILDYDTSYTVEIPIYSKYGEVVHKVRHKVDYRIHNLDGSYELVEAKGREGDDWKWRSRLLEKVWKAENPDHEYTVRKQKYGGIER